MITRIIIILSILTLWGCSGSDRVRYPDGVDRETLIDLGEFLMDKNKVYRKYSTSDETIILELKNVDRESFQSLGKSIYGKDKSHVFDSRNGIIKSADAETFQEINLKEEGLIAYGKDKNNYYFWNNVITDTIELSKKTSKENTNAH